MKLLIFSSCLLALVASQSYGNERSAFDELKVSHNVQSPVKSSFNEPLSAGPTGDRYSAKPSHYSGAYRESPNFEGRVYTGPNKFTGPSHFSEAYKKSAPYNSGPAHYKSGAPLASEPYSSPFASSKPYSGSARLSAGPESRTPFHYESGSSQYKSGPAHYESSPANFESGPSRYESTFSGPSYYSRVNSAPSAQIKKIKNPKNYLSAPTYEKIVQVEDVPRIGQNGVPLDTSEVARAKAAHLEAHAKVLSHLRYRRAAYHHGHEHHHHHHHGHGHAYSTQNHNAHFGHHHPFHVHEGHGHHHRRRRGAYHHGHGHAYSTQNHNAHFGHPHVVHVGGHHHHHHHDEHDHHHIFRRDTYSSAGSTQNANAYHGESKPIRVASSGYPGAQVPHETAEVQLAKQAHFLARDKALKQTGQYRKPVAPPSPAAYRGYESRNEYARYQAQPEEPFRYSGANSGARESYESREYY